VETHQNMTVLASARGFDCVNDFYSPPAKRLVSLFENLSAGISKISQKHHRQGTVF
jgi:hypothetical protein